MSSARSAWSKGFVAAALAAATLVGSGCGRARRPGRVLLVGLDGADPRTIDLLISEGKLPTFAKIRQEGAYAPLQSAEPLLSPIIWTTVATGKTPDHHRIGHFVAVNPQTGQPLPVTSRMRAVKAVWNVLSEQGRSVAVVGWWATWPAEKVNGAMVSDHFAWHFLFRESPGEGTAGRTYPESLAARLAPLAKRPQEVTLAEAAPYATLSPEELARPFDLADDLSELKWALATTETYRRVALELWTKDRPDTLLVYFEGLDTVSHLFGHLFRAGPLSGELAEQQKRYGNAVEAMYVAADGLLGEFVKAMDRDTTLVVLSDHGFRLGQLPEDPSRLRDMRRVSEAFHRPQGILYLYGRDVRGARRVDAPTILDLAPTLLALNGVPPAHDMPGRVLDDVLDVPKKVRVATYEGALSAHERATAPEPRDEKVDAEAVKRLKSLGYLGATSPSGDRNLAAILFEQKRYAEAAAAYAALLKNDPKDAALHASLGGVLGAMGRYDRALTELDEAIRLDPIRAEAYHNRGAVHERRGERAQAVTDYRSALRFNPDYLPSRQALATLGETPEEPRAPVPGEAKARALAEEASVVARRGDYAGARRRLDEAERLAPRLVLVQQYRSNVAYLQGDIPGAIAALKKGLELEPGNLLFRTNLARLEAARASKR